MELTEVILDDGFSDLVKLSEKVLNNLRNNKEDKIWDNV